MLLKNRKIEIPGFIDSLIDSQVTYMKKFENRFTAGRGSTMRRDFRGTRPSEADKKLELPFMDREYRDPKVPLATSSKKSL